MSNNDSAVQYLQSLSGSGFWGFLTFKLENGQVVHVRREENLKPNDLQARLENLPGKSRETNRVRNLQN